MKACIKCTNPRSWGLYCDQCYERAMVRYRRAQLRDTRRTKSPRKVRAVKIDSLHPDHAALDDCPNPGCRIHHDTR